MHALWWFLIVHRWTRENSAKKCCRTTLQELLYIKQDSELVLESLTWYLHGPSSVILLQLCFILKGTLPFYSKETLNTLLCHKFINTYAKSIACLAEGSPVKQNTLSVKSTMFKNRAREFCSGRPLAVRLASKRGGCYQIHR